MVRAGTNYSPTLRYWSLIPCNHYEIDIGTFENAVSPDTDNFREFPQWVEDNIDPTKQRKVAMFCTGGIRCEKASALVAQHG